MSSMDSDEQHLTDPSLNHRNDFAVLKYSQTTLKTVQPNDCLPEADSQCHGNLSKGTLDTALRDSYSVFQLKSPFVNLSTMPARVCRDSSEAWQKNPVTS